MARLAADPSLKLSGKIGKEFVFKNYGDKIVVTRYPDMSRVKPGRKQKNNRNEKDHLAYWPFTFTNTAQVLAGTFIFAGS